MGPAARVERDARAGEDDGPEAEGATPGPAAPGTGRDEYDSLPIDCEGAIASRQEDERTIVYITPTQKDSARPGQWVHCAWKDRPPSSACEVLDIVDGGMLEASCGEVKPGSRRPPK
ncbi:hypothetical protein [Nannocystis punicea]|uniref:Uncharacterized protein n=1 Tax=Nannocystis punicea TaxID=2995304 RepID=A0ABY7H4D9_9BACT|nr:hypothetical protein [Nannocystis poenicansa]WAS94141.1 hypothetical protein O0S08_49090 [Nannocystis poenicansa]